VVCVPLWFFTRHLLRPGVATALPRHAAIDTPLRRAFDNVQTQLSVAINQAQFSLENLTHSDKFP